MYTRSLGLIGALTALAGCGRIGFEPASSLSDSSIPSGHDEDADGVRDTDDNCPWIANPAQTDTDRDGVPDRRDARPNDSRYR